MRAAARTQPEPVEHPPRERSFEDFLIASSRRLPLAIATVGVFFLIRSFGIRSGPVLIFSSAAVLLPLSLQNPLIGFYAILVNSMNEFDSYYKLQSYIPISLPIAFDLAVTLGILFRIVPRGLPKLRYAQNRWLLLYVSLVCLSSLVADLPRPFPLMQFRTGFLIRPILYLFMIVLVRSPRDVHGLLLTVILSLTLVMAGGMSDYVQKGALAYRVQGTLEAVNYLSYVCVVMVPVLLSIFVYLRDRRAKAFVLALTLAAMFVSLQTASRSGYYALIATLGFLAFRFARRPQLVVAALAFGFVFYELLPAQLLQRLSEVEDIRQSSRYVLSQIGLRMMLDNPLFGVGFGQRAYMAMFPNYDYEHLTHPQAPHSLYFAIGACHGIPALVAYLAIFVVSFQQLLTVERDYRRSRQTHALGYFLAVGLQSAIVGHLIFGLAGSYGDSYYAYLVLGLSVILVRLHQERAHAPLV